MEQSLINTRGTPPGGHPRCITLEQIPRYADLYRRTGKPPRVNVKQRIRFNRIDLRGQPSRWLLSLSDGRRFPLKPGTNRFEPSIELEAGAWFIIHMARNTAGLVRLPEEGLTGWVNEDDYFDSLLSGDDDGEPAHSPAPEGERTERPALPKLNAPVERQHAIRPIPPPAPTPVPVENPAGAMSIATQAFTFGRRPRGESLLTRLRRRVFQRSAV